MSEQLLTQILTEVQDMKLKMNNRFDTLEISLGNVEAKVDHIQNQTASNFEQLTLVTTN